MSDSSLELRLLAMLMLYLMLTLSDNQLIAAIYSYQYANRLPKILFPIWMKMLSTRNLINPSSIMLWSLAEAVSVQILYVQDFYL